MNRNLNLTSDSVRKLYVTFLWPSVAGMLATSCYVLIDTIFIGRGLGNQGLAALDISLPVYNMLSAIGYLLGVGGATAHSTRLGRRKGVVWHSIAWGVILSFLCILAGQLFITEISLLLGASSDILTSVNSYVGTLLNFSPFMILNALLVPIISNDNAPKLAMWSFVVGGITNTVLDAWFIFVLPWGMWGAAFATGIASVVSLLVLSLHFISPACTLKIMPVRFRLRTTAIILLNGLPSFIIEFSAGIVIFIFNRVLLQLMGELGIAAYSIIANISFICGSIYSGIAHALQPLVSVNYGARKWRRVARVRNLSVFCAFIFGLSLFLVGQFFPSQIVSVFVKNEPELLMVTVKGIKLYFLGFLPMGINIALGTYFQSMEFFRHAIFISLGRGAVFILVGLLVLPSRFGIVGVWLVIPFAETLAFLLSAFLSFVKLKPS